jgi:predicted amino acid-binding ACT domain protein
MKQLTIITQDRPGLLSDIASALAEAGINIEDIDPEAAGPTSAISIAVDRYDAPRNMISRLESENP